MKFLCLDIPQLGATLDKYQPHMVDEAQRAWTLYESGLVRNMYFRQDRPGVAIIADDRFGGRRPPGAAPTAAGQGRPH